MQGRRVHGIDLLVPAASLFLSVPHRLAQQRAAVGLEPVHEVGSAAVESSRLAGSHRQKLGGAELAEEVFRDAVVEGIACYFLL